MTTKKTTKLYPTDKKNSDRVQALYFAMPERIAVN